MFLRSFTVFPFLLAALAVQGNAAVSYKTSSDWGSGFNGEITLVNDTTNPLSNWTVEFDFAPSINLIWNAAVVKHTGTHYVLGPVSWNADVAPGGTVSIGFGGAPGNITTGPKNLVLNGLAVTPPPPVIPPVQPPVIPPPPPPNTGGVSVSVVKTGQWNGGFGANLVITNNGSAAINNWTLGLNFSPAVTSLWNANYTQTGNALSVSNLSWNASIAPGGNVSVGLNGNGIITDMSASACMLNGIACTLSFSSSAPPPVVSQGIGITGVDGSAPAIWFTIAQGSHSYPLTLVNPGTSNFSVVTSNPNVAASIVNGTTLQVNGAAAGRASLRITESVSGTVRYVGVRVRNADGSLPGMPKYLSMGSVSEDTTGDLAFWKSFEPGAKNKRVDVRYIYLNGGPVNGWDTWGNNPGDRATTYIRNSHQLGMIPFFVFYNIADGGESYYTDKQHVQDSTYMAGYFRNLKLALDIINQESPDDTVGMVLEPDFLGYLAQAESVPASQIMAMTHAAYASGVLTNGVDPVFPDTVKGLVQAINYTISKYSPQVFFGWQMNLWASPAGGWTTQVPGNGIIHKTDAVGIAAGRPLIRQEATAITNYYVSAGVLSYGAKFISIDKYGFDAAGAEASAAQDPSHSIWFWNNDLWGNYLVFVKAMHDTTGLPVILWQLPVGHINNSQAADAYTGGQFPVLSNANRQLEDSTPDYFLGDTFQASGARYAWFGANQAADAKVTVNGNNITWGQHMDETAAAGVMSVLFGAGVGASTGGVGDPPTDSYWWISAVQGYYSRVVPLR